MQQSFSPNTKIEIVVLNGLLNTFKKRKKDYTKRKETIKEDISFYRIYRIKVLDGKLKALAECINDVEVMKKKLAQNEKED